MLRNTTSRLAPYVELRLSPSLFSFATLRAQPPRLVAPHGRRPPYVLQGVALLPSGRYMIVATEYARLLPVVGAAYRGACGGGATRACSRPIRPGGDCHDGGLAGGLLTRTRRRGGVAKVVRS